MREVPPQGSEPQGVRVPEWSEAARRPGESERNHKWLRLYLAMSPSERHLADVARIVGASYNTVRKTASRWSWSARARSWDHEQRQGQAHLLREQVSLGMTRGASAASEHMRTLHGWIEEGSGGSRMATSLAQTVQALKTIGDYANEVAAAVEPPPVEYSALAERDPQEAAKQALVRAMTTAERPSDRVSAARAVQATPDGSETSVEQVFALMSRIRGELSSEAQAEVARVLASEVSRDWGADAAR